MREKIFLILLFSVSLCAVDVVAQTDRKTIKKGIVNGSAKHLPPPEYPQPAKDVCADGKVEVETTVYAATGKVISAKAISGDELLREAAEAAARKVEFTIPLIDGSTLDFNVEGILVYNFVPEKKCLVAGVVNKKAKVLPPPDFPKSCRCSGNVFVQVIIDERGDVIRAKAFSGHPLLRVEAEKAARLAKFPPTNDMGKIRVKAVLIYNFEPKGNVRTQSKT